jgi:protein-S-isoprenylcysteine O-methyltransferase Ste14
MKPDTMRSNWLSRGQVAVQVAGIVLSCYPVGLANRGAYGWLVLSLAGAAFGLWTLFHNRIGNFRIYPEPRPQTLLVTSGPYRLVRHPMYCALLLAMLGIATYNGHALNLSGFVLVVVAVYSKAVREESFLKARFPEYAGYARTTPRFIPRLRSLRAPGRHSSDSGSRDSACSGSDGNRFEP